MRQLTKKMVEDRKAFGGIDPMDAILHLTARYTLLPEIFDMFGREKVLQFLERFGGRVIKVPSLKNVEEALLQLTIWHELQRENVGPELYKRVAARHGIKESDVRNASVRVQEMIDAKTKLKDQRTEAPSAKRRAHGRSEGTSEGEVRPPSNRGRTRKAKGQESQEEANARRADAGTAGEASYGADSSTGG